MKRLNIPKRIMAILTSILLQVLLKKEKLQKVQYIKREDSHFLDVSTAFRRELKT
jgi:hypothetical protein